ncbi:MAG: alanine--tRNA ligase-related protein, partial [Chloroflexota bacterium]
LERITAVMQGQVSLHDTDLFEPIASKIIQHASYAYGAAVMQGPESLYDTDLFEPIVSKISQLTGYAYGSDETEDKAVRIIAEHSRGLAFLLADGVFPSNEGRGYVLRRLLRRAQLFGQRLGLRQPFLSAVAEVVIEHMGETYPELKQNRSTILKLIEMEEGQFSKTFISGLSILNGIFEQKLLLSRIIPGVALQPYAQRAANYPHLFSGLRSSMVNTLLGQMLEGKLALAAASIQSRLTASEALGRQTAQIEIDSKLREFKDILLGAEPRNITSVTEGGLDELRQIASKLSGEQVFTLYDTYGFAPELTAEIAQERGFSVDLQCFHAEMEKQRERARAAHKFVL